MFNNRYGADKLSFILIIASIVISLALALIDKSNIVMLIILLIISAALLIFAAFRIFSRNIEKRMNELHMLEILEYKLVSAFHKEKQFADDEQSNLESPKKDEVEEIEYKYFKCPKCKKPLKVPSGQGYVNVICPTCSYKFMKHT